MHPYHHPLFLNFIVYFNRNQDYFECHEVLEEYWKSVPGYTKDHPLTAFILLSTGLYHWRRGNVQGAYRTLVKAEDRMLHFCKFDARYTIDIDYRQLVQDTERSIRKLQNGETFSPFLILLTSETLQRSVDETAATMELLPVGSNAVIHKHMLRDRSDILAEREKKRRRH
jgi:predicted metal-dependent hydrolase